MISDLASSGALPVLQEVYSFAGARQRLLAHNIANLQTPGFKSLDVSVRRFREDLAKAVAERRSTTGGQHGELGIPDSDEIERGPEGFMRLTPATRGGAPTLNSGNDSDVERLMQGLAENTLAFRLASDLIRRENQLLHTAISQRV
ncbi:MAG: hypothetical protein DYG92_01220 [Leptolyngbya sp. PLA1]|nr:hypothetical protein [Leptolyngbya sp. PLA1]